MPRSSRHSWPPDLVADEAHADLRGAFGPVRDQGRRPTCLVFALSSAHEHGRDQIDPLSPEALFTAAKKRDGLTPAAGTTLSAALVAVEEDGQCDETAWPYGEAAAVDATATYYRARAASRVRDDLVNASHTALDDGEATLLVLRVTDGWFSVGSDGLIPSPTSNDRLEGNHAVVAVGYDDSREHLVVRNSWGSEWGDGGHGWLPYDYVDRYGLEAVRLGIPPGSPKP